MLALYLLALVASSGLVGVFVHHELALQGYVATFNGGVLVACGVALGYLSLQLLYMTAVRFLKPTKDRAPLFCEVLSLSSALALLPALLQIHFLAADPALVKYEPLLMLGVFGILHLFFKLASFFAALWSTPSGRLGSTVWLVAAATAGMGAYGCITKWTSTLEAALQRAPDTVQSFRIDGQYADARVMPEGALFEQPIKTYPGQAITLRWAKPPDSAENADLPQTVYVNVAMDGTETRSFSKAISLKGKGWNEVRIGASNIPPDAQTLSVSWSTQKDQQWQKIVKYRPVITSQRQLLMSGPFSHETRSETSPPNFVVILVDGLGDGPTVPGHKRDLTPALDHVAAAALSFSHAYTPAPDSAAAVMTTLTGVSPLRHGYLGGHQGPLPASYRTIPAVLGERHYTTAAFMEADGDTPALMGAGSGFEKGFEVYDTGYSSDGETAPARETSAAKPAGADTTAGSQATLRKVRAWVDAHNEETFFVFVRLRELNDLVWRDRYAPGVGKGGADASVLDTYESAVAFLDRRLGELITHLREKELRKNTCVLVTSTHGYDFSMGPAAKPSVNLSEDVLNVPLLFLIPGVEKAQRHDLVSLQDIAPSVLKLADALEGVPTEGTDFVRGPNGAQPISVWGDPLQISVRTDKWRFTWQTVASPFKPYPAIAGSGGAVDLFEASQLKRGTPPHSVATRVPDAVNQFRRALETYLTRSQQAWKTQ